MPRSWRVKLQEPQENGLLEVYACSKQSRIGLCFHSSFFFILHYKLLTAASSDTRGSNAVSDLAVEAE